MKKQVRRAFDFSNVTDLSVKPEYVGVVKVQERFKSNHSDFIGCLKRRHTSDQWYCSAGSSDPQATSQVYMTEGVSCSLQIVSDWMAINLQKQYHCFARNEDRSRPISIFKYPRGAGGILINVLYMIEININTVNYQHLMLSMSRLSSRPNSTHIKQWISVYCELCHVDSHQTTLLFRVFNIF